MQPAIHNSWFVHHIQMLSSDFSRYLSHSTTILPDALGHNEAHGECAAELPGICNVNLVSDTMATTYRQVRGRAASLSPKSRPQIPLPAQSALCLPRNLLTTAHTVRKMQKFLNGRCVPYDGQDGAAIGCSVSASVFSHRAMRHRRALVSLFCAQFWVPTRPVYLVLQPRPSIPTTFKAHRRLRAGKREGRAWRLWRRVN